MRAAPLDAYRHAAALGLLAGLRSVAPLAVVGVEAARHPAELAGTLLAPLARPGVAPLLLAGAVGEMAMDKLPFLPARVAPLPLGMRLVAGALAGGTAARAARQAPALGALAGAGGAFLASHLGYRLRRDLGRRLHLSNLVAGLLEDALVVLLGRLILRP